MESNVIVHPFEPIYDAHTRVLILGSFPSVISRKQQFYYANHNNRFWSVMEHLFDEKIEDRTAFCLKHHIGLWDVIHSCSIKGSSDSSISDVVVNDISGIIKASEIRLIVTTGNKATKLYEKYIVCDCKHIGLPSTSSANAKMRLDDLVRSYQVIYQYAEED